jgi:hypothetical protein
MRATEAVLKLSALGYRFEVAGEKVRWCFEGPGKPDPSQVRPLLDLVKEHKPEVLAYLSRPIPTERVLTCYDCGHFHPAVSSPNPTQAWGSCQKSGKGRYGCAMACEAIMIAPEVQVEENPQRENP